MKAACYFHPNVWAVGVSWSRTLEIPDIRRTFTLYFWLLFFVVQLEWLLSKEA